MKIRSFILMSLLALSTGSAWAQTSPSSLIQSSEIDRVLHQVLEHEQQSFQAINQNEKVQAWWKHAFETLVSPVQERFRARDLLGEVSPDQLDLWLMDAQAGNLDTWSGVSTWKSAFLGASDQGRCEELALAYIAAVWQVSTMPPESPIVSGIDSFLIGISAEIAGKERARATWVFRYLRSIAVEDVPLNCQWIKVDADLRWDFIMKGDRRALGFAVGMCGRPMNAHYIELEIDKGTKEIPSSWKNEIAQEESPLEIIPDELK